MAAHGTKRLANLVIAGTLMLQAVAGFKLLCPPQRFEGLAFLRVACNPTLWPFLEYNMYNGAHAQGERHRRLQMFATLQDGRRVQLRGEDFGMSHRAYHTSVLSRLAWAGSEEASEGAAVWAQVCRIWSGKVATVLEIERRFHFVESGDRPRVGPAKVLRRFELPEPPGLLDDLSPGR